MSWTLARILGVVGIVATVSGASLAAVARRRGSGGVSIVADVALVMAAGAGVAVAGWSGGVVPSGVVVGSVLVVGVLVGLGCRAWWSIVAWAAGVIVSQVAALAASVDGLEVGLALAWFGVGMVFGASLAGGRRGRRRSLTPSVRHAGLAGAVVLAALSGPSIPLAGDRAGVGSASTTTVAWTLVETVVNVRDEPTEFVSGVTPGYFGEPRFDGTFERVTVSATSIVRERRSVDQGVEYWHITTTVTLDDPPTELAAGDEVTAGRRRRIRFGARGLVHGRPVRVPQLGCEPARRHGARRRARRS